MILIGCEYQKLDKIKYVNVLAILCTVKKRNCFHVGELKYICYALKIELDLVLHLGETYYNFLF